jgi:hypothetical protein
MEILFLVEIVEVLSYCWSLVGYYCYYVIEMMFRDLWELALRRELV